MLNQPFKSSLLSRPGAGTESTSQPPHKRPRLDPGSSAQATGSPPLSGGRASGSLPVNGSNAQSVSRTASSDTPETSGLYFTVLWRKFTLKKHKVWDGDGVMSIQGGYAHLYDEDGQSIGKTLCHKDPELGTMMSVSGKDVEITDTISREAFLSGRKILGLPDAGPASKPQRVPQAPATLSSRPTPFPSSNAPFKKLTFVAGAAGPIKGARVGISPNPALAREQAAKSSSVNVLTSKFRSPVVGQRAMAPGRSDESKPIPRFDPDQPGALVMKRPASVPRGKQIVDVVVDPVIGRHLREHQREGVKFMYECVMGMKNFAGEGCVLADEMGLGKTLQTIALLWTLLHQNPVYRAPPVVKKAIVVCPVSLVNNWRKEFRKWLGNERLGVFIPDSNSRSRITDFTKGKVYNVMIVGYEKLRTLSEELSKASGIDIVIADEGHRLKTAQNKSAMAIKTLNTSRRVILSGTPIQNDMSEFFTMVDFVNPGLLGKYNVFKREFENPILRSRQPNVSAKDAEKGRVRADDLAELTGQFILRRTADILSKYLPPKTEYVFFCPPTPAQAALYRAIVSSPLFFSALGSAEFALQLIGILRKACSSPQLLVTPKAKAGPFKSGTDSSSAEGLEGMLRESVLSNVAGPVQRQLFQPMSCSKVRVLDRLLHLVHTSTDEKVVLVSNWTSTLDILGAHLASKSYSFLRLDGSTPPAKRQGIVDRFNRTSRDESFVFLLSAKAGGVGLNLIGASRLVLFDIDWNPSVDLQTMARIHRDGQKRECHIYRLLTMGALDEKVYQRQITKQSLADTVVDKKESAPSFTREELRDLFSLDESGVCKTHVLIGCQCGGKGNFEKAAVGALPENSSDEKGGMSGGNGEDDDYNPDEDLDDLPTLMTASQINFEEQENKMRDRKMKKLRAAMKTHALMKYIHFENPLVRGGPVEEGDKGGKTSSSFSSSTSLSNGRLRGTVIEIDSDEEEDDGDDDVADVEDGDGAALPDGAESPLDAGQVFDDPVTIDLLSEPDTMVKYVFSKTTS